jgi:hypothetical protein
VMFLKRSFSDLQVFSLRFLCVSALGRETHRAEQNHVEIPKSTDSKKASKHFNARIRKNALVKEV